MFSIQADPFVLLESHMAITIPPFILGFNTIYPRPPHVHLPAVRAPTVLAGPIA